MIIFYTITGDSERFQYSNFEISFLKNENRFKNTEAPFFIWKYHYWKRKISIQNCSPKSQYIYEYNEMYKRELSRKTEFYP